MNFQHSILRSVYKLIKKISTSLPLSLFLLQGNLKAVDNFDNLPIERIHLDSVISSTHEYAKNHAPYLLKELEKWVIITADHPLDVDILSIEDLGIPGRFECTFMTVYPSDKAYDKSRIKQIAALSIARMLKNLNFENVQIKWPDRVLINEKEVASILYKKFRAPNFGQTYLLIGTVLNINLKEHEIAELLSEFGPTTSMLNEKKVYFDEEKILELLSHELKNAFHTYLENEFEPSFYSEIDQLLAFKNQLVEVRLESDSIVTGKFAGVDKQNFIKLEMDNGLYWIIERGKIFWNPAKEITEYPEF